MAMEFFVETTDTGSNYNILDEYKQKENIDVEFKSLFPFLLCLHS